MSPEDRVADQAFFVFHTPGASRHGAGKEVCDVLERSNGALLGRQGSTEWEVEAWFLGNPDLASIDGNDRQTDEATLAFADQLHAPGCHAILVGFDTIAPAGAPPASVAHRALSVAAVVTRYAPTEVGPSLSPDQHLVDALVARAARLTAEEWAELVGHIDPAELPTYDTMVDFDRGFGHKIASPPIAREVNRAWSRAVAALGRHTGDRQLEFAVGAAAGALAIRSQVGGWDRWDTAEYLALTRPWREVIGPLHTDDIDLELSEVGGPGLATTPRLHDHRPGELGL